LVASGISGHGYSRGVGRVDPERKHVAARDSMIILFTIRA
jgi:hypothetical protein